MASSALADEVLPLIRTRADLHRRSVATAHGRDMHEAVNRLESAWKQDAEVVPRKVLYDVTHRALPSSITVIARADDSSGVMGHAIRRLLELHPKVAAESAVPVEKLVDWMIDFEFGDNPVDYFHLDPVAYAAALGERGIALYKGRLDEVRAGLGAEPGSRSLADPDAVYEWFSVKMIDRRLAVLARDVDEIIRTHAGDGSVAAWLQETAEALAEIGRYDLAIDWAKRAMDFDGGHQSQAAARYWCQLLAEHQPDKLLDARFEVFRRWPTSSTAAALYRDAGDAPGAYYDEVMTTLTSRPGEAVLFALLTLDDVELAWKLAHELRLDSVDVWDRLVVAYSTIDPTRALPVHQMLVTTELTEANARGYRRAAKRLAWVRGLPLTVEGRVEFDDYLSRLRHEHRRRPRLLTELDRVGLH